MSKYEDDIKEAIRIILSTAKGERVMQPDFGCGIHEMIFETINATTLSRIEKTVREALTKYEPRIEIVNVSCDYDAEVERLLVSIDYRVRSTDNQSTMVYPFHLS